MLAELVNEQQTKSADAAIFVTGDFNNCSLKNSLPHFHQYVDCPTRLDRKIDLCYGNIKDAYKSTSLPPIGTSDHNAILLESTYRPLLKRVKPEKKTVTTWNKDDVMRLQGCFDCTNWDIFAEACTDIHELCDTVTDYIKFCEDLVFTKKEVTIYPNTKPWVNSKIKILLHQKNEAFKTKNKNKIKDIDREIKSAIRASKADFKRKIEEQFSSNNPRETWAGLKTIMGYTSKKNNTSVDDEQKYANDLNLFYARFENNDLKPCNFESIFKDLPTTVNTIVIDENEVRNQFERVRVRKASGPDGIKGNIIKMCSTQLSGIFTLIFNKSLLSSTIPALWKCSKIIPVPKKDKINEMNDLRPVALTSIIMKCFEKIMLCKLKSYFTPVQDQFQFAYRENRSVEDAIIVFLDNIYRHLDRPNTYCRILFADFSSAFNTISPSILVQKLIDIKVHHHIIAWIWDFLTNRTQFVQLNNVQSLLSTTNTGAPQGCVLSPVLFTLYTNECKIDTENLKLIKFADDSTIQGLIKNIGDEEDYKNAIAWFTNWCQEHRLKLNVKKPKEIIIDFRKKKSSIHPISINDEEVEQVLAYKYLGITINNNLEWQTHVSNVFTKINKRMFFLRKLKSFDIDTTLLRLFYHATIESIVTFCIAGWGGNVKHKEKEQLIKIIKRADKISKCMFPSFDELYICYCLKKINAIFSDPTHPLNSQIEISTRSKRPLLILCRRERYKRSFLPYSIKLLSSSPSL